MTSFDDLDVATESSNLWAAVIAQGRNMRQGGQHIDFGQGERGLADAARFCGNGRAQTRQRGGARCRRSFPGHREFSTSYSFSSGSGKALGIDQGLLALVVGRSEVQIRLRDFEVIAKDGVELYFQRRDAGALPFALLDLRQVLFAVAAQVAKFVEIFVHCQAESRRRR